jgi:hypothetical protein
MLLPRVNGGSWGQFGASVDSLTRAMGGARAPLFALHGVSFLFGQDRPYDLPPPLCVIIGEDSSSTSSANH